VKQSPVYIKWVIPVNIRAPPTDEDSIYLYPCTQFFCDLSLDSYQKLWTGNSISYMPLDKGIVTANIPICTPQQMRIAVICPWTIFKSYDDLRTDDLTSYIYILEQGINTKYPYLCILHE